MDGHSPGRSWTGERQRIRLPVAMLLACFEIGWAPGRRDTHEGSPRENRASIPCFVVT
jgi:hypothetical protein